MPPSILNRIINNLPLELHLPGYQYCGPGTRLKARLKRGDPGINPLDRACRAHDIAYAESDLLEDRHRADTLLAEEAWRRANSSDASFWERLAALGVAGIMRGKVAVGMGHKKRRPRSGRRRGIYKYSVSRLRLK